MRRVRVIPVVTGVAQNALKRAANIWAARWRVVVANTDVQSRLVTQDGPRLVHRHEALKVGNRRMHKVNESLVLIYFRLRWNPPDTLNQVALVYKIFNAFHVLPSNNVLQSDVPPAAQRR
jgi:hypothetical protein